MRTPLKLLPFIAAAFLAGCTNTSSRPICAFAYDGKMRDELIVPAVREKLGDAAQSFDLEKPFIFRKGDQVEFFFDLKDKSVAAQPHFVVTIDPCENRVRSAEKISG